MFEKEAVQFGEACSIIVYDVTAQLPGTAAGYCDPFNAKATSERRDCAQIKLLSGRRMEILDKTK